MTIARESSSADPPQQLRERKNELILEPKDCGGGAVMSYMERVCMCWFEGLSPEASSSRQIEMDDRWFCPPWPGGES